MKILLDFLPLVFFFATYKISGIYPAEAAAFATHWLGALVQGGIVGATEAPALLATVVVLFATLPAVLDTFGDVFTEAYSEHMRAKLGLELAEDGDKALLDDLLGLLAGERVDHTIAFRALGRFDRGAGATPPALRDLFIARADADAWGERYLRRLASEPRSDAERQAAMDRANPKYILRNHLAQRAIDQAASGDFAEVRALHELLRRPCDEQPDQAHYAALPPDWAQHIEVSCSS